MALAMKTNYLGFLVVLALMMASCGGSDDTKWAGKKEGRFGGVLRYNEERDLKSLFPPQITDNGSYRVARNLFDGLFMLSNKDGSILPALAETYTVNEDATIYTFKIRHGVYFHDDPCFKQGKGRELNAHDIKFCLKNICEPADYNNSYWIMENRVLGANEYYESRKAGNDSVGDVKGLRVIDDFTMEITLTKPFSSFIHVLTTQYTYIYPHEAFDKYGPEKLGTHAVGTGAFILKEAKRGEHAILIRNENYWRKDADGRQLPYLDGVMATFRKDFNQLASLRKNEIDVVFNYNDGLMKNFMENNKSKYRLISKPEFSVTYLGFLHTTPIFTNKKIRRAMSHAIDKKQLAAHVMQGTAIAGNHGYIPPFFEGYEHKKLKGSVFDPDIGKELLAEAGYPDGYGFPVLEMTFPARNAALGGALKKMLEDNLGIQVDLIVVPFQEVIKRIYGGHTPSFRMSWSADFPDPESFFNLFHSSTVPEDISTASDVNLWRYKNSIFDSILDLARMETDEKRRFALYLKADQELLDDVAAIPLFYNLKNFIVRKEIRNLGETNMDVYDLSELYFVN